MGRSGVVAALLGTVLALGPGCGSSGNADAGAGFGDAFVASAEAGVHRESGRDATDRRVDAARKGSADASGSDAFVCADAAAPDGATAPICVDRCGPLADPCSGKVVQCGGCPRGGGELQACNLPTNTCGPVHTTCADVNAECGSIVTSCGTYIDCPDGPTKGCPAGQQCNTDDNECEACQAVTCADLGFECGPAWLGCGPDSDTNYTNCGSCAAGQLCNAVFNLCEPGCMPAAAPALCSKAGAQCGVITNGCGGTVDCDTVPGLGCASGQSCGVAGEANQCDPPVYASECVALGRTCGTIVSVCTGAPLDCGDCAPADTCSAAGACCVPSNTGASYAAKNECGTALPDGCGNDRVDVSCPPPAECVNNLTGGPGQAPPVGVVGTCCKPQLDCAGVTAGHCMTMPDTCNPGGLLECNLCTAPQICSNDACVNPTSGPVCPPEACNLTLRVDGGAPIVCACREGLTCSCGGQACIGTTEGTCLCPSGEPNPYTCENVPDGPHTGGQQCGMFNDGCGGTLTCECTAVASEPNLLCTAGQCVCTPSTCDGQVGNGIPDGCGGTINCAG